MPRGQRNNVNANDGDKKTRTVRPRLTDEQKAIAEVEKLRPRVAATEKKLKEVRAKAAELDTELKADQKLLTWALQNPFLPEGYADQADVPAGTEAPAPDDAGEDQGETADVESASQVDGGGTEDDDIPGADVVSQAAEERVNVPDDSADDEDDPFAGH